MNELPDFSIPQRQSLLGIIVYLIRNGRSILSLLFVTFAFGMENPLVFMWFIIGIIVLTIFIGYISYRQFQNFTFQIKDQELIIHKGVFVKERKTIPLSRIQSVQIEQNIIQQVLGVVGLKIDSAGSSEKELEIPALSADFAESFRSILKKKEYQEDLLPTASIPDEESKTLVFLSPRDLLKVGLTENHIRNGILAVLVVYGYASQYFNYLEEYLEDSMGEYITRIPSELIRASLVIFLVGIGVFILVSVLVSLGQTILKFYNYQARIIGEVVEIKSGLLKKNEYRIPVHKIQFLKWESNPLRKILGFTTSKIYQVESSKKQQGKRIEIPACYPVQTLALEELVYGRSLPTSMDEAEYIQGDVLSYTRFYTVVLGIPVVGLMVFLFIFFPAAWYLPSLSLPIIAFLSYKYGQSIRMIFYPDILIIHKGWIFPTRTAISYYKCQAVKISDNMFLRTQHLTHLTFHTASGSVKVRYIPQSHSSQARDYILYCVQRFKGRWM
jgi:putative membrane protein